MEPVIPDKNEFHKGFPEGKLGRLLQIVYEIKLNGLEYLFKPK
ncbi:putative quorum-sensing-regulated virulence factor [Desulfobacter curvatus]|nr:DUF3820 family protein [Desulfobacter curvatus]